MPTIIWIEMGMSDMDGVGGRGVWHSFKMEVGVLYPFQTMLVKMK